MKAVKLGDLRNETPEIKDAKRKYMNNVYKKLGDDAASDYFNNDPEFRGILKNIRKGVLRVEKVLDFLKVKNKQFDVNEQVEKLAKVEENFGPLMFLIQEQEEKKYSLTPEQVEKLVNAMAKAEKNFGPLMFLIQEQEEKKYSLTPEQVEELVNAMAKAEENFGPLMFLIQEQEEKKYNLTPEQVEKLKKAISKEN